MLLLSSATVAFQQLSAFYVAARLQLWTAIWIQRNPHTPLLLYRKDANSQGKITVLSVCVCEWPGNIKEIPNKIGAEKQRRKKNIATERINPCNSFVAVANAARLLVKFLILFCCWMFIVCLRLQYCIVVFFLATLALSFALLYAHVYRYTHRHSVSTTRSTFPYSSADYFFLSSVLLCAKSKSKKTVFAIMPVETAANMQKVYFTFICGNTKFSVVFFLFFFLFSIHIYYQEPKR